MVAFSSGNLSKMTQFQKFVAASSRAGYFIFAWFRRLRSWQTLNWSRGPIFGVWVNSSESEFSFVPYFSIIWAEKREKNDEPGPTKPKTIKYELKRILRPNQTTSFLKAPLIFSLKIKEKSWESLVKLILHTKNLFECFWTKDLQDLSKFSIKTRNN